MSSRATGLVPDCKGSLRAPGLEESGEPCGGRTTASVSCGLELRAERLLLGIKSRLPIRSFPSQDPPPFLALPSAAELG